MSGIKRTNMSAVLHCLRHHEAISRVQLARTTGLSNTTITNLTAELLQDGIIAERAASADHRGVGRPRQMLQLVPNARYVVSVHVGIGQFRVALANLRAELLIHRTKLFPTDAPAETVLAAIIYTINEIIADADIDESLILGAGIGLSGLVNQQDGINLYAPRLGWRNVPVRAEIEQALYLPVCVDNNVRAMALGEAYFGIGRDVDVLAFVYGRVGVGAGFVVNGRVFRGSGIGAGEIGHTIMIPADDNHGSQTLETLVSEQAIISEALTLAAADPAGPLALALNSDDEATILNHIFTVARAGDNDTRTLIEKRAYYLGIALANLVNILNPEMILLGGLFNQGADLMLPVAEETMRQHAFAHLGQRVRLETTYFGWQAGIVGAAALALTNFVYQEPA